MDKRITIEVTSKNGETYKATGWLEDWILAIYLAMPEEQRLAVRLELEKRAGREKR